MKSPRLVLLVALVALGSTLIGQTTPKGKGNPFVPGGSGNPCGRPAPKPIVAEGQAGVKAHSFKKTASKEKNSKEATETLELASGEAIKITHWGCKYTMVTFHVESKALLSMGTGVAAGYQEAAKALRALGAVQAKVGFDLEKAAKALEATALDPKVANITPVPLGKGSKEQISVKGAGSNPAKTAGFVDFEFMRGPL